MPELLWAEISIQFLLPAIFLVIWALNQVFGKTTSPPPPPGRERMGPRPMPTGPSRAPQTGRGAPGTRPGQGTMPKPSPGRDAARSPGKGAASGRDRSSPQARPAEPARTPKPRPAVIDEVYAIYEDERASLKSVDQPPPAPFSAEALRPAPMTTSRTAEAAIPPILGDVLGRAFDAQRLREAYLLSEVLAPPVALQGRSRRMMPAGPSEERPQGE